MKTITAILLCLFGNLAQAGEPWSETDKTLEVIWATAFLVDVKQSLDIKNHPNRREANPVVGDHPSDGRMLTFAVLTTAGHVLITDLLPSKYRTAWQVGTISLELYLIQHNAKMGLRLTY